MKNYFYQLLVLFLLSFGFHFKSFAQMNLIPNPGFEDAKPNRTPMCDYSALSGLNHRTIEEDILFWTNAKVSNGNNNNSSPDWMDASCPHQCCFQYPSKFIFLEDKGKKFQDAIRVGLFSTMNPTKNYVFKITYLWVPFKNPFSPPPANHARLKVILTKHSSNWGSLKLEFDMFPPHYQSTNFGWEQHWHVLNGPLLNSQIYFGNIFKDLKNIVLDCSEGSMYIDYVELAENCASPLLIENHQFYNTIDEIPYKSAGVLKAGFNVGNPLPNGNVIVNSGANVIFKAADQIILEPGFVAEQGSNFQTIIEPCNINTAREDNTITIIDDKTIQIGDITIYDDRVETLACNDTLRIYGLDGDTTSFINYFWDFGNGQTSDNPIGEVFYETPGEYTVTLALTDSLNVTDTLSKIYIQPDCNRKSSATNSTNNENNYVSNVTPSIFPNPTSGNFTITQLEQFAGGNITIINLMGQVVLEQKINSSTLNINLANQPKGIYLIKINSEKESVVQKVVVE